jgi:surface antigen
MALRSKLPMLCALLATAGLISASIVTPTEAAADVIGNDYPVSLQNAAPNWYNEVVDGRGFYVRNCTSFVAWRIAQVNDVNFYNDMWGPNKTKGHFGNANHWDDNARKIGFKVDSTPAVGAIAQTDAGFSGHVAWVAEVHSDGTITIEQYNGGNPPDSSYSTARVKAKSYVFIHVKDLDIGATDPGNTASVDLESHIVPGDFNRDGYADTIAFYGYNNNTTAAFLFRGNPKGVDKPVQIWNSGTGNWNWDRTKLVPGDFNRDGYADTIAFYGYNNNTTAAFLFRGNPKGVDKPVQIWNSGTGNWNWDRS